MKRKRTDNFGIADINGNTTFITNRSLCHVDQSQLDHPNQRYQSVAFNSMAPHYDFIIGRGKNAPRSYMNFPLNPKLRKRNLIYIDPNPSMDSDIKQMLHDVDFSFFGICKEQDPMEEINVRFFFDWSTFYCTAVQSLTNVILGIGRKCQIFVPLNNDEKTIPSDVKRELCSDIFTLTIVEGTYPLFDWNATNQTSESENLPHTFTTSMRSVMNPDRYMRIDAYSDL